MGGMEAIAVEETELDSCMEGSLDKIELYPVVLGSWTQ